MQNVEHLNAFKMCVNSCQYCVRTNIILWIVHKHFCLPSLLFIALYTFFLVDLFHCLVSHFFTKTYSFVQRSIGLQILGCTFVTEPCIALLKPLYCIFFWCIVICPLIDVPKFYGKYGFNCAPLRHSIPLSSVK